MLGGFLISSDINTANTNFVQSVILKLTAGRGRTDRQSNRQTGKRICAQQRKQSCFVLIRQVVTHNWWLGRTLQQAVDERRLYHRQFPYSVVYDREFSSVSQVIFDIPPSFWRSAFVTYCVTYKITWVYVCAFDVCVRACACHVCVCEIKREFIRYKHFIHSFTTYACTNISLSRVSLLKLRTILHILKFVIMPCPARGRNRKLLV